MPLWAYYLHPFALGVLIIGGVLVISMLGLIFFRRFVTPTIDFHDGVNDAISGTVQSIGVFYGVTIGLLAVGVWNTWSNSANLVSNEAAYIAAFYRDVRGFPQPMRGRLCDELRTYTRNIIDVEWKAQKKGEEPGEDSSLLDDMHDQLNQFEPKTDGDKVRYAESMAAFNRLLQARALRLDAVGGGLSQIMWGIVWSGFAISIGVAYFFHLRDFKLHASLVGLMAAFLGLVLYMIVVNDRPFVGEISIPSDSYELVLKTVMRH